MELGHLDTNRKKRGERKEGGREEDQRTEACMATNVFTTTFFIPTTHVDASAMFEKKIDPV